jgi:hypothetical protein
VLTTLVTISKANRASDIQVNAEAWLSLAVRLYTPVAGWKSSLVAKSGIAGGQSKVHAPSRELAA